ncbi:DUF2306 domain-containing protein [Streptomyces pratensis]|uniref:DUF2306 domain-containing protein n=1 Tax=Streptomyces pratensis TaxID=1169025 RepID=UPI003632A511
MVCVAAGAVIAVIAATYSISGFTSRIAFYVMSAAWLYTLVQGYRTIRRGEVRRHRIWMIRNYALTFTAVTLRVFLGIGGFVEEPLNLTFEDIYFTSVWGSFLLNVLATEYFLVQRILAPPALRMPRRVPATPSPAGGGTDATAA